jgi:hypothetical protein
MIFDNLSSETRALYWPGLFDSLILFCLDFVLRLTVTSGHVVL